MPPLLPLCASYTRTSPAPLLPTHTIGPEIATANTTHTHHEKHALLDNDDDDDDDDNDDNDDNDNPSPAPASLPHPRPRGPRPIHPAQQPRRTTQIIHLMLMLCIFGTAAVLLLTECDVCALTLPWPRGIVEALGLLGSET
ncbi:hypothetical protein ACN47E_005937 [Coniothyrium glycines]